MTDAAATQKPRLVARSSTKQNDKCFREEDTLSRATRREGSAR